MNYRKFKFWSKIKAFVERRMKAAWFEGGNCDSCCPRCKLWESAGNIIHTKPSEPDNGSDIRACQTCGYQWVALFTPAGFVEVYPPPRGVKRLFVKNSAPVSTYFTKDKVYDYFPLKTVLGGHVYDNNNCLTKITVDLNPTESSWRLCDAEGLYTGSFIDE